jgi:hypothetical protein
MYPGGPEDYYGDYRRQIALQPSHRPDSHYLIVNDHSMTQHPPAAKPLHRRRPLLHRGFHSDVEARQWDLWESDQDGKHATNEDPVQPRQREGINRRATFAQPPKPNQEEHTPHHIPTMIASHGGTTSTMGTRFMRGLRFRFQ